MEKRKSKNIIIICKKTVFTDNSFAKCSWAHVVTSFKQSHVSQSGDICPILACVFLWNPCMPSDTITCYQWACLPAEMFRQVFLSIPQHSLSHLVFTNATTMIKWNIRPIYFVSVLFSIEHMSKSLWKTNHILFYSIPAVLESGLPLKVVYLCCVIDCHVMWSRKWRASLFWKKHIWHF